MLLRSRILAGFQFSVFGFRKLPALPPNAVNNPCSRICENSDHFGHLVRNLTISATRNSPCQNRSQRYLPPLGRGCFTPTNHGLLAAVCVLMVWGTAGLASAAPAVSEETLANRRKTISQLNDSQRQELVRKYDSYRQLSESERNHLRKLHQDIEANGELKDVMDQYCDWLKNLDVTQREQLRQAKTPEQKRDLVVKLRAEQLRQKSELWRENGIPPLERRLIPPLSSEVLTGVMTALETELVKKGVVISKERQAELEKLHGTRRYKLLMRTIGEYRHPKDGPVRHLEFPEAVVTALEDKVQNPDIKRKIRTALRNSENPPFAQRQLFFALLASTLAEAQREFNGSEADELKESLFQSLSPEMVSRFSQLPPRQRDFALGTLHKDEIWRAFAAAGDFPNAPVGDRNQPGRGTGPFFPRGRPDGDRPRDGGQPDGFRPQRRPQENFDRPANNGRRQPSERNRDGESNN